MKSGIIKIRQHAVDKEKKNEKSFQKEVEGRLETDKALESKWKIWVTFLSLSWVPRRKIRCASQ